MTRARRLDERTTFHTLELASGVRLTGQFRMMRVTGDLTYAPANLVFVVSDDDGRTWPLGAVTCLYANEGE